MNDPIFRGGEVLAERYVVDSSIGEGGMQQVYRATDRAFGRSVAVKVPKNASAERRFARSAQVSARVNHPHVAKTLDYFEEDGRPYLIEELIVGSDLGQLLEQQFVYLDPHLAAHLFHHLVTGLAAAHHAKVFHRDLKPSNVMVSADPGLSIVKITDFGIAKMAEEELNEAIEGGNDTITSSQTALGALPYIAPEMIDRPREAGQPADVWALGAMLYHLVSGHAPFGRGLRIVPAILEAKLPDKPEPFAAYTQFSSLADDLWTIIQACLKKDPKERPSADKLVEICSGLCYADSARQEGRILNFGAFTGSFGFIRPTDGENVFFHQEGVYGSQPVAGLRVNFAVHPGSPRMRAYPVLALRQ
jgi:eukaryotic-like serine/threonine-protein kinase